MIDGVQLVARILFIAKRIPRLKLIMLHRHLLDAANGGVIVSAARASSIAPGVQHSPLRASFAGSSLVWLENGVAHPSLCHVLYVISHSRC